MASRVTMRLMLLESISLERTCQVIFPYAFEKQFQNEYTIEKFSQFRDQVTENVACYLSIGPVVDGVAHFTVDQSKIVGKKNPMEVEYAFTVKFNEESKDTNCNRRMFKSKGVVCAHMVSVWGKMKIREVPQKYILDRWKKNLMRSHTKVKVSYSNWQRKPEWRRWDQIQDTAHVAADKAMHSDAKTVIVVDKLNEAIEAIDMLQDEENVPMSIHVQTNSPITGMQKRSNVIGNPTKGPRRGRPPTMRKQSRTEKSVKRKTAGSGQKDQGSKRNRLMDEDAGSAATEFHDHYSTQESATIFSSQMSVGDNGLVRYDLNEEAFSWFDC